MPELPEVETIRRGLEPHLRGLRIVRATVRQPMLREQVRRAELRRLQGATITGLRRRSKYLLIDTAAGQTLLIHLGMSGRLLLDERGQPEADHQHVTFLLDDDRELRFIDARRFGMVRVLRSDRLHLHPRLRGLGAEPLDGEISGEMLYRMTRGRRKPVKNFLMDARSIAGVGNIYACEALHRAGVNPRRQVRRLGLDAWEGLLRCLQEVLRSAIRSGGTTLRDFQTADGDFGYFAISLRVYDREGEPCRRCGGTIRRIVQAGRSTFYCPRCQR